MFADMKLTGVPQDMLSVLEYTRCDVSLLTLAEAAGLGATHVVVGRPIMETDNPLGATERALGILKGD